MKEKLNKVLIRFGATTLCALILLSGPASRGVEKSTVPDVGDLTTNTAPETKEAEPASTLPETVTKPAVESTAPEGSTSAASRPHSSSRDIVKFGRPVVLKAGETANGLVVIGSSAIVHGKVRDAVVAIGGNITLDDEVGGDVVAVMGSVNLGTNANVHGDAVTVMGAIKLAPGAQVRGDTVAVGGSVERPDGVKIGGEVVSLTLPGLGWLSEMGGWVSECLFKLRPLSFKVGWVWVAAGIFLLLYLLVALAFPRPVQACVEEVTRRPATTLLMGLLTKILIPIVTIILLATGIGIFIVPFLFAALWFASVIGKAALLVYFGRQLGRQFGSAMLERSVVALLVGWIIITLLYVVPVLGMVVYGVTGMWALGAAVTALFSGTRREMPERPQPPPTVPPAAYAPAVAMAAPGAPPVAGIAPMPVGTAEGSAQVGATPPTITASPVAAMPPVAAPEAWTFPRSGFWERMGAGFLDIVLVSILGGLVGGPPLGFLVALAYFAGMWAWKGTTIGGIVLKLKVVRLDGQPVTFPVALVRGLAAAFSVIVFFLGFLWIAWDKEKQAWHDKIAGTAVVRLPRSMPLVCV